MKILLLKPYLLLSLCFPASLAYAAENPEESTAKRQCIGQQVAQQDIKIANLCIDAIFKHGLHESGILINLLNTFLNLKDDDIIKEIDYLDKELPTDNPLSSLGYSFTVDLRCRSQDGRQFLIEMQNDFRDDYHMKALVEHSRMIAQTDIYENETCKEARQTVNKKDTDKFWKSISGIYTLVFTNKSFGLSKMKEVFNDERLMEPDLINPCELRHIHNTDRRFGDIPSQIILVMLHNLKKKEHEVSADVERWCYLFKDPTLSSGVRKIEETKIIHDPEKLAGDNQYIAQLIERIKVDNIPSQVKETYISRLRYYNGALLDIEQKAHDAGKIAGQIAGQIAGKIEGEIAKSLEIAKRLIRADKLTDEEIASITDVTIDTIKELRTTYQSMCQ